MKRLTMHAIALWGVLLAVAAPLAQQASSERRRHRRTASSISSRSAPIPTTAIRALAASPRSTLRSAIACGSSR